MDSRISMSAFLPDQYKQRVVELYNRDDYDGLTAYIHENNEKLINDLRSTKEMSEIRQITKHLEIVETSKTLLDLRIGRYIEYTPNRHVGLNGWGSASKQYGSVVKCLWDIYELHFLANANPDNGLIKRYEVWPNEINFGV